MLREYKNDGRWRLISLPAVIFFCSKIGIGSFWELMPSKEMKEVLDDVYPGI